MEADAGGCGSAEVGCKPGQERREKCDDDSGEASEPGCSRTQALKPRVFAGKQSVRAPDTDGIGQSPIPNQRRARSRAGMRSSVRVAAAGTLSDAVNPTSTTTASRARRSWSAARHGDSRVTLAESVRGSADDRAVPRISTFYGIVIATSPCSPVTCPDEHCDSYRSGRSSTRPSSKPTGMPPAPASRWLASNHCHDDTSTRPRR